MSPGFSSPRTTIHPGNNAQGSGSRPLDDGKRNVTWLVIPRLKETHSGRGLTASTQQTRATQALHAGSPSQQQKVANSAHSSPASNRSPINTKQARQHIRRGEIKTHTELSAGKAKDLHRAWNSSQSNQVARRYQRWGATASRLAEKTASLRLPSLTKRLQKKGA